jgi:hypothetical protein
VISKERSFTKLLTNLKFNDLFWLRHLLFIFKKGPIVNCDIKE